MDFKRTKAIRIKPKSKILEGNKQRQIVRPDKLFKYNEL